MVRAITTTKPALRESIGTIALLGLCTAGLGWVIYYLVYGAPAGYECPWLQGFKGNLVGEFLGGVLFLLVGMYLGRKVEALTVKSAKILADHEYDRQQQVLVNEFLTFLHHEGWHDVRFPNLPSRRYGKLGLLYTIEPVRDKNGPRTKKTEMELFYIIKVRAPALKAVLSPEDLQQYDAAPIHTDEAYFCRFINGAWHMGRNSVGNDWHRFYLSGKQGPAEYGQTADEFLQANQPPEGFQRLHEVIVNESGVRSNAGSAVSIYKDQTGSFWVQPSRSSPPKAFRLEQDYEKEEPKYVIDNFEGYFPGEARGNFINLVLEILKSGGHEVRVEHKRFE